ncbi:MAG: methylated-DNA--[protein]-cysteine S-methyltransferase [Candidatus Scalindua sediminis]|nr:methylated-DNA--[protein]-cysteine S-methyltransferase [Candidatus Scalindua sediminis]
MTDKIYYSGFYSPFGPVFVASTLKGICLVSFSKITETKFLSLLRKRFQKDVIRNDKILANVKKGLLDYFNGCPVRFKVPLDLSIGTQFQRKVWRKVKEIPYGELRSYKWVARSIGSAHASRAVGNAVGQNPVAPIVPCHRVICSDGSLGGYSSGIAIKKRLLNLEGISGDFLIC